MGQHGVRSKTEKRRNSVDVTVWRLCRGWDVENVTLMFRKYHLAMERKTKRRRRHRGRGREEIMGRRWTRNKINTRNRKKAGKGGSEEERKRYIEGEEVGRKRDEGREEMEKEMKREKGRSGGRK